MSSLAILFLSLILKGSAWSVLGFRIVDYLTDPISHIALRHHKVRLQDPAVNSRPETTECMTFTNYGRAT